MNRYDCELARDGQKWRFKRITIDNAWVQGDPEISCHAEALSKEDQRPGRSPGVAREIEAAEIALIRFEYAGSVIPIAGKPWSLLGSNK